MKILIICIIVFCLGTAIWLLWANTFRCERCGGRMRYFGCSADGRYNFYRCDRCGYEVCVPCKPEDWE